MKRFTTSGSSGFTLIELLIVMALGIILLTALTELLRTNSMLYSSKENTMIMTQDLRAATDIMIREIRMAGCNPTAAGGIGFQNDSSGTSIHFTMDTDGNGTIASSEDITYSRYQQNGIWSLGRITGGATGLVAEYINAVNFTYFNAAGTAYVAGQFPLNTANLANIYAVDITINAQTPRNDPITRAVNTDAMTARVRIRNAGLE